MSDPAARRRKVRSPERLPGETHGPREVGGSPEAYGIGPVRHSAEARAQLLARARELRSQGLSYERIAAKLGIAGTTARRWLIGDGEERHYPRRRASCGRCGAAIYGAMAAEPICGACRHQETRERRRRMASLWNAGGSLTEIAEAVGMTARSVAGILSQMRLRGADIDVRLRMGKRRPAAYRELRREREEEIARLQAAGFTLNGIAERLGMSEGGVMQALGRLRRAGRELPNGRAELARRRERAVTRGLRRGSAPAEIAAELGVSTGTVHHIIQRLRSRGVELPPTGRAVARARAQRIVELRRRSMKLREIGEIVGLTTGGVNSVLRRHRAASLASAGERKFGGTHR